MIKPLHRKLTTSTRCALMLAAPSRDWNVFKQIFAEHWDGFTHAHPRYQTAYYHGLVAKMLDCGNPDKMGSIAYRCLHCGQGKHLEAPRPSPSTGAEDDLHLEGVYPHASGS